MEALTIETFKPDKIKAISVDEKVYGETNYTSVKFSYDGGEMPPIRTDGKFKLFRFKNKRGDYSLSITCDASNEFFFREICKVISKET